MDGFDNKKNVCVKLVGGKELNCFYTTFTACGTAFGERVISLSNNTNAHIGNNIAYPNLVLCCK